MKFSKAILFMILFFTSLCACNMKYGYLPRTHKLINFSKQGKREIVKIKKHQKGTIRIQNDSIIDYNNLQISCTNEEPTIGLIQDTTYNKHSFYIPVRYKRMKFINKLKNTKPLIHSSDTVRAELEKHKKRKKGSAVAFSSILLSNLLIFGLADFQILVLTILAFPAILVFGFLTIKLFKQLNKFSRTRSINFDRIEKSKKKKHFSKSARRALLTGFAIFSTLASTFIIYFFTELYIFLIIGSIGVLGLMAIVATLVVLLFFITFKNTLPVKKDLLTLEMARLFLLALLTTIFILLALITYELAALFFVLSVIGSLAFLWYLSYIVFRELKNKKLSKSVDIEL